MLFSSLLSPVWHGFAGRWQTPRRRSAPRQCAVWCSKPPGGRRHGACSRLIDPPACPPSTCRQRSVPLVCRRWREQLAHTPRLLRHVDVKLIVYNERADYRSQCMLTIARVRSLCEWLGRHAAQHMERLRLKIRTGPHVPLALEGEVSELLGAALAVCSSLTELEISMNLTCILGRRLQALASMQRLSMNCRGITLTASLQCLTVLQHLRLMPEFKFQLVPDERLPASLTFLDLILCNHMRGIGIPGQVRRVPLQLRPPAS